MDVVSRSSYGNTWWGEQWLNALTHLDYDNRLPRGRAYANKGAVRDLQIADGYLQARVQGSRLRPYQVSIRVPPLAEKDVEQLLDAIGGDPALIARLLNRELDPAVLEYAQRQGIAVFPTRWQDLSMQCSCPDWAVPCKHLAAAIYLLSREIDGNPFLVFSLRGVDLVQALKTRGIHIERQAEAALPFLTDLLPSGPAWSPDVQALDAIDFARLPELMDPLLAVLPARPVFFAGGDLRDILRRAVMRAVKRARKALDGSAEDGGPAGLSTVQCPFVTLMADGTVHVGGAGDVSTLAQLDEALSVLSAAELPDHQPEVAALYQVRQMALHLLAHGAVVPQVYAVSGGWLGVRWLPALLDDVVAAQQRALARALPPGLARLASGQALAADAQAGALCALFVGHYLRCWSRYEQEKPVGDTILALLFGAQPRSFTGPGERETGAAVQGWLSRYHLAQREFTPVLCLDEGAGDGFALTLAVVRTKGGGLDTPVPMRTVLCDESWCQPRFDILQTVALLAEFYPPLNACLRDGASESLALGADELPALLFDALPAIRLLGIRVLLPRTLESLLRPRLSLELASKTSGSGSGLLNTDDLFSFDWKVALGKHRLTRAEFEHLVQRASGVVRFKGEYVYLDPREIENLRAQLARPPVLTGPEPLRGALAGEYGGVPVSLDDNGRRLLDELRTIGELPLPEGLDATLRPYQQRGYAWMLRNLQAGFGCVIADDMGLGKTLQVIATLLKLKQEGELSEGKALVVMPTSLLTNWQKEIARFAPGLSVGVFHGGKRELTPERPDVLLTTYGVARSAAAALKVLPWRVLVVDEAQNIKNPAAAQTRAIKAIPAASCIAMSGTPVENSLSDYWSIMDFANRGYLGALSRFEKEYATPIQIHRDKQAAERFGRVTAPFLLRRLKSDRSIISDLPDKVERDHYCELGKEQAALYESLVREGLRTVAGESDAFKRQGLVLQLILALKQVCNHPALYLKQPFADPLASGKLEALFELLDELYASHGKALIFTQFREMGDLLARWLGERYGRTPMFLHGAVARARRDEMVDRFQSDRTERVFLLSLKAGGTGLNLTAASTVIHFDLWWNPAVEAQATDRAYRIGQQSNVQVHRFITTGTFEERINHMIRSKRELAELTVGRGEQWIGDLDSRQLKALFELAEGGSIA